MSSKRRGTAAERELIHLFWEHRWAAFRAAGSGSIKYPCPDVIAGNAVRKLALEVKLTKQNRKYFTKKEVKGLRVFAEMFGAEPWVGVRFLRQDWVFLTLEDMEETKKSYVVSKELAERRGLSIEQLIELG